MYIVEKKITEVKAYGKNPRKNDQAVEAVANSIKEFGFKVPIVIDKDGVIVCGHTRVKAAKKLGMQTVPCIIADDLTDEQIKAFRLADNKVSELAEWDFDFLDDELSEIFNVDMEQFGFGNSEEMIEEEYQERKREFEERMAAGDIDEGDEEYQEFLDKFAPKKTTDDCYTPQNIYEAVEKYVEDTYGVNHKNFVRPFYPGGDYTKEKYTKDTVVVDNPPFSIISEICRWYQSKGIRFFLFAPTLTVLGIREAQKVVIGATVTYENGAKVNTSFATNMSEYEISSNPALYKAINEAEKENLTKMHKELPKYSFPKQVATACQLSQLSKYGEMFGVKKESCVLISKLDDMQREGKGIYGSGYLISEKAAAEKAAAEKAAAEKAAAEKAAAEKAAAEKAAAEKAAALVWKLSERELEIIKKLV